MPVVVYPANSINIVSSFVIAFVVVSVYMNHPKMDQKRNGRSNVILRNTDV